MANITPLTTLQIGNNNPITTSNPPNQTANQTATDGNGNWYEIIPGALNGAAGILDVFYGQPDTYVTNNQAEEDNTMTIVILLIVAIAVLYFLLK